MIHTAMNVTAQVKSQSATTERKCFGANGSEIYL